jgi:hypothetical protein
MARKNEVFLVSEMIPLVSAVPPISMPRFWGIMPSFRWGRTVMPVKRRRELSPLEMSIGEFLAWLPALPFLPILVVKEIAESLQEQAKEELDLESIVKKDLLENKMGYESGEISEEEYKERESKLTRRLEEVRK